MICNIKSSRIFKFILMVAAPFHMCCVTCLFVCLSVSLYEACKGNEPSFRIIIQQAVQCFHIFLHPFNYYSIFFLQLPLSFQSSSINPISPMNPLIPSAQVSLGLPYFLLLGGRHFITSLGSLPSSIL